MYFRRKKWSSGRNEQAGEKIKDEKEKAQGKVPELKFDEKIKGQMGERGWMEQYARDTVARGQKGKPLDQRCPK